MDRLSQDWESDRAPDQAGVDAIESTATEAGDRQAAVGLSQGLIRQELRRKATGPGVDGDIAAGVAETALSGSSGELPHRDQMEERFGTSLGDVAAHTGPEAQAGSDALGAEAFTVGSHVGFRDANPTSAVVAHEVTHVLQQTRGGGAGSEAADEAQADAVEAGAPAAAIAAGAVGGGAQAVRMKTADKDEAAAPYTEANVDQQVRLALRAAGAAADQGVANAKGQKHPEVKGHILRAAGKDVQKHLKVARALHKGDGAAYAGEAAALVVSIDNLLVVAVEFMDEEGADALIGLADDISMWGGTVTKPTKKHKGFDKGDRREGIVLGLRGARDAADDALAKLDHRTMNYEVIGTGGELASTQLGYVHDLVAGHDEVARQPLQNDIETATRSVGRLVAWANHARKQIPSGAPAKHFPLNDGWVVGLSYTASQIRELVGLPGNGWIGDIVDGVSHAPDATPPDKKPAQKSLNDWNFAVQELINETRRSITNNWIDFIGATSENPQLSWDAKFVEQMMSNLVGNALTALGENLIKKGSAAAAGALFGSLAGPAGTAIGFVVGLLVETAASIIFDFIWGDHGQAAARARAEGAKKASDLSKAKHEEFSAGAQVARGEQQGALGAAQGQLDAASSQAKVDAIQNDVDQEKTKAGPGPAPDSKLLFHKMLGDWVREHAGNRDRADRQTNETQWENANKELTGDKDLESHPETFAFQSRAEWKGAGLNDGSVAKHVAVMREHAERPGVSAASVKKAWDERELTFDGANDGEILVAHMQHKGDSHRPPTEAGLARIKKDPKSLHVTSKLELGESGNTCFVKSWVYNIVYDETPQGEDRHVPKSWFVQVVT